MCGICGQLSWARPPAPEIVERMARALAHRGPDAQGVRTIGPAALGHRRLAIIDLSPDANQPMADHTGGYGIVFNGEIYNFASIRADLEARGATFHTRSDTEVILEAYKAWGEDCLARFNGMFAFALWDGPRQRLFLARDRFGKKPLFYHLSPDGVFSFASELTSLCCAPEVPRRLNPRALGQYLSLNYVLTSECMLSDVRKLPAAHCMAVTRSGIEPPRRYWDLAAHFRDKRSFASEAAAVEEFDALFSDAVRARLVSDVPLGAFLSGGIDSSSVVAAMCGCRAADMNHTFSIGFREKSYSELPQARLMADHLGVTHRDRIVDADMATLLPQIQSFADEPFADTSFIPMYFLAEFARRHVTVCLSGDGGDELLAGYETYAADRLHRRASFLPGPLTAFAQRILERRLPVTFDKVSFDYKLRQFLQGLRHPFERAHYSWREIFTPGECLDALQPDLRPAVGEADPFDDFARFFREAEGCHDLDRAMYVDIKTWLVDDILFKVDRSTMAHALEARAPFLDFRLAEFAASLPVNLKMRGGEKKVILRRAAASKLPPETLRQKKRGFNAPVAHWLEKTLAPFVEDLIEAARAGDTPFRPEAVRALWADLRERKRDTSLRLLSLVNFEFWRKRVLGGRIPG